MEPHRVLFVTGRLAEPSLRRLLAAVVDDPSLNERDTLLRMCAPESID